MTLFIIFITLYAIGTAMFAFTTAAEFKQVVIEPFMQGKETGEVRINGFDLFQTLCCVACVIVCVVQIVTALVVVFGDTQA